MAGRDHVRTVSDGTLAQERSRIAGIAPEQAAALEAGCRVWRFVNAEGFDGEIIVWPDVARAALVSAAASHWGRWDDAERAVTLDTGDVYNQAGGVGEDA